MRIDYIKVGMEVCARHKSVFPESWNNFVREYPSRIARVMTVFENSQTVEIGNTGCLSFCFHLSDLAEVESCCKLPPKPVKSLKSITIFFSAA